MKRFIVILGTLLIATVIIISGSAVATWVYVTVYSSDNCTDIDEIEGAPDDDYASLGEYGPPAVLGWVLLDLGSANAMPNSQDFTVFAGSAANETYEVHVIETPEPENKKYVGTGYDTKDFIFQTPSTGIEPWRYIYIMGTSGDWASDPAYGPDIDAVGWDKP
jgi:hypothetical protein